MTYELAPSIHEMNYRAAMTVVENQRAEIATLKTQLESLRNGILGWAIVGDGEIQAIRHVKHGMGFENEPYTQEDVSRMNREWAGYAPHEIVTLIGIPYEQS